MESLLTLEHPRGSYAIHRRSCNLDGKHLKKLRSKGRPSDCARAQTISKKQVWIRKSMDKTTTTTCRKQSGKDQAFARYTGNAEDRTSLAQLSAKIKASLSAFEKVDMTMESTAQKPANSSEFWLVWTSDQSSFQPASCQITCELGLLFEDPRRCSFQLVHLLHHQGLPLHCV